ncbi:MAG TPA: flippase-like domain-containing protein [Nitrospirae bacterium]|nr:flippase-like domain-containing protein [Nitrospirota bacterium]
MNLKKIAFLLLKIIVSAAMVYFLVSKIGLNEIIENISKVNPVYFIIAVAIYLVQLFIASNRWGMLIENRPSIKQLYSLYLIGAFFGIFLPGLVGGDTVKAYYLNKMLKTPTNSHSESPTLITSIASVFMDRYIGFIALITMVIVVFPFSIAYLKGTVFIWLLPTIFTVFIAASLILIHFRLGDGITFIANFYKYLSLFVTKRHIFIKAILLSFVIQSAGMCAVYILSIGLGMKVSFIAIVVFLPIIILLSFIPITIAGIGLREGAFVFSFSIIKVPSEQSLTLSILWFLSTCTGSLFGLVEYLRIKKVNDAESGSY